MGIVVVKSGAYPLRVQKQVEQGVLPGAPVSSKRLELTKTLIAARVAVNAYEEEPAIQDMIAKGKAQVEAIENAVSESSPHSREVRDFLSSMNKAIFGKGSRSVQIVPKGDGYGEPAIMIGPSGLAQRRHTKSFAVEDISDYDYLLKRKAEVITNLNAMRRPDIALRFTKYLGLVVKLRSALQGYNAAFGVPEYIVLVPPGLMMEYEEEIVPVERLMLRTKYEVELVAVPVSGPGKYNSEQRVTTSTMLLLQFIEMGMESKVKRALPAYMESVRVCKEQFKEEFKKELLAASL
jgi:hypothetical protein